MVAGSAMRGNIGRKTAMSKLPKIAANPNAHCQPRVKATTGIANPATSDANGTAA